MYRGPKKFNQASKDRTRRNEMIRVTPIRLIDQAGEQAGIVELSQAMKMAQEAGLDLVEISPKAKPPVCKIIDWGKYQYQQAKKRQGGRTKQKKNEIKGIRIRPNTGEGDLEFKLKQAKNFLEKGNKVKVEIVLRGREKAFMDQAKQKIKEFVDKIEFTFNIEQSVQKQFNGFSIIIAPQ